MNYIYILILSYIGILIVQFLFLRYSHSLVDKQEQNIDDKMAYNIKNKDKLTQAFSDVLRQRVSQITNQQMKYDDWLDYNNKNIIIHVDGHPYYIFLYEKVEVPRFNSFICKAHAKKEYINLSWEDILKDTTENLIFTKFTTDKNLIENMYGTTSVQHGNDIQYYWVDALTNNLVAKQSHVFQWIDNTTKKSGVIGIGYDFENLNGITRFTYYQKINKIYMAGLSLLTLIMAIVLQSKQFKDKMHYHKPLLFLFITNIYILYFLNNREIIGSTQTEMDKKIDINSGILSVSFLVGVNIFILTTLQKSYQKNLFVESGFVFSISLILLLVATFKSTNNMTINDIIENRITKQIIFNLAIIFNALIVINYIIYVLTKAKV